jgi:hypothetical protein
VRWPGKKIGSQKNRSHPPVLAVFVLKKAKSGQTLLKPVKPG